MPKKGGLVSMKNLEKAYSLWGQANQILSKRYPRSSTRTEKETIFSLYLEERLGFRVMKSVWISKFCLDIFIPEYRVAIELNGSVHNRGFKIVQDFKKDNFVMSCLGIPVFEVWNHELNKWKDVITKELMKKKQISKSEEAILINRILVETLPVHPETMNLLRRE